MLGVGLHAVRPDVHLSSVLLLYLLLAVCASAVGGLGPGLVTTVGGFAWGAYFFTEPFFQWTIADSRVVIALAVFVVSTALVSALVDSAERRRSDAERARGESAALARLSAILLDSDDPLPRLVHDLRATFGLQSAAILRRVTRGWELEVGAGGPLPQSVDEGTDSLALTEDLTLVLCGPRVPADDRRVFAAFTAQLAVAVAKRRLAAEAAEAAGLARANELRTALLSAVSHDLRTPLATIKAWTTSLLSEDVEWPEEQRRTMLEAVVSEVDRLNGLVGNLLDMSRLQTGVVEVSRCPVALDDVVAAALAGLQGLDGRVEIDLPMSLPQVEADPALLERVIANLVANAVRLSPGHRLVRLDAGAVEDRVDLRIVDRGPGIPQADRERVFQPFQRLGDRPDGNGTGLGLAVAQGLTRAIGGDVMLEDTPGGGATMIVRLKVAT